MLRTAPLIGIAALLIAGVASAGSHHTSLYYVSSAPLSETTTRPLVAYVDAEGHAIDWLYDGMIVFSINIHGSSTTDAALDTYRDSLFSGGQLEALRSTVAALRTELSSPSYKLKVYLAAPYASGANANDRVQELLNLWQAWAPEELALQGFYWGYEESSSTTASQNRIKATAQYLHNQNLELIWIPYFNASGVDSWKSLLFDRATLQPNYAFSDTDVGRFLETDNRRRDYGLSGVELEIAEVKNPQVTGSDTRVQNAEDYFTAADTYNWSVVDQITYYHGSDTASYATQAPRRTIYDRLYRFVSAYPNRATVADYRTALAAADGFVDLAEGYQDAKNGKLDYLNLGSNAYPNAIRVFLRFNLADLARGSEIPQAVHLRLQQRGFPYGDTVDDIEIHLVEAPWEESTVTGNNQPSLGSLLAKHRFGVESAYPHEHVIDVTESVRAALAGNQPTISFGLKRTAEDGTTAEAQLHSRESGDALAPRLVAVYPRSNAVDAGTDAPDAASPPDVAVQDAPVEEAKNTDTESSPGDSTVLNDGALPDTGTADTASDASHKDAALAGGSAGSEDKGCGCRTVRSSTQSYACAALAVLAGLAVIRRRRVGAADKAH